MHDTVYFGFNMPLVTKIHKFHKYFQIIEFSKTISGETGEAALLNINRQISCYHVIISSARGLIPNKTTTLGFLSNK